MEINGLSTVVTGGASGLGLATAKRLIGGGATVVIADLPTSAGESVSSELGKNVRFVAADVTSTEEMQPVFDAAEEFGPLRAVVHCAGRSQRMRIVEKDGTPGPMDAFEGVIRTNLIGSFNVLRLAATRMVNNEPLDGDRGAIVMTASIAAWEGQIGQINYAASKAGIVGMTLVAARDLSSKGVRVCTIAPGVFDTPLMNRVPQEVRDALGASVPHPRRMGDPAEFGHMAVAIIENPMMNGETVRLDGALRMAPR